LSKHGNFHKHSQVFPAATAPSAYPPSIHIGTLYEKTSARGVKYLVGRLGYARLTLLPGEPAADGTPTWRVLLEGAAKADRPSPAKRSPNRPPRDGPALSDDQIDDVWRDGLVP
jgi:hypothetical protein